MQFVFSWLIGLIFHLNCNLLTERKLFFTYMLYNIYLISSVLAGEGMVLSGRGGEGRGGEGSVEKNGGGTWSVTNDNSYIYIFEFI